jgi:MarR-like DNA-binding transcriptional regulator SgrR of sgrS sRNA
MEPEDYLAADASALKRLILVRLAQPSERSPKLRELADQIGCAMSTLYVALEQMRAAGWVSWRRGSGGSANTYQLHAERIPRLADRIRCPRVPKSQAIRKAPEERRKPGRKAVDKTAMKRSILTALAQRQKITLDELAVQVGCPESTLRVALNQMRSDGWVSWNAGIGIRNVYTLHPDHIPKGHFRIPEIDSRIPEAPANSAEWERGVECSTG